MVSAKLTFSKVYFSTAFISSQAFVLLSPLCWCEEEKVVDSLRFLGDSNTLGTSPRNPWGNLESSAFSLALADKYSQ